jgi:hypothetical protein
MFRSPSLIWVQLNIFVGVRQGTDSLHGTASTPYSFVTRCAVRWSTVTRGYTGLPCGFQCRLLHPAYLVPVCRRCPVTQQSCNSNHQRIHRSARNMVYKIPRSKQEVHREERSGSVRRAQPFWCLHCVIVPGLP